MTLDLNEKDWKSYMIKGGGPAVEAGLIAPETTHDYVRSYAVSCVPQMLSEVLRENGYQSEVSVIKSNAPYGW